MQLEPDEEQVYGTMTRLFCLLIQAQRHYEAFEQDTDHLVISPYLQLDAGPWCTGVKENENFKATVPRGFLVKATRESSTMTMTIMLATIRTTTLTTMLTTNAKVDTDNDTDDDGKTPIGSWSQRWVSNVTGHREPGDEGRSTVGPFVVNDSNLPTAV